MTQHVFARLAGFQLTVIPLAPYRIRHADAPPGAIDIEHHSPTGRRFARLIPDDGGYRSKIDEHTKSLFDVVDISPGPALDQWRVETTVFTCCWPSGYTLCSNNFPNDPGPFDLVGANREMIYIQHPRRVPDVAEMCGPNQTVVDIGRDADSEWIDLRYEHDGLSWQQRHEVVTLLGRRIAVTMQSPAPFADDAVLAAQQVVRSLAPYEDES